MSEFGERERIRWLEELFRDDGSALLEGIGDDAALLELGASRVHALSTDSLVAGRHFDADTSRDRIGHKSAGVSLSDMAAVAADPICLLVSAGLTGAMPEEKVKTFFRGVETLAGTFDCAIAGGDLCRAEDAPFITTVALGACPHGPVRRDGARPGDRIFVSGRLGGSLRGRHLTFTPRVREALEIAERDLATAMMDVSDGLTLDLDRLLERSGCPGAVLEADRVPVHPDAREAAASGDGSPLEHALSDGEDFELVLTVDPADAEEANALDPAGTTLTDIGRMTGTEGLRLASGDGTERPLTPEGYQHF